ncbi:MAG: hypothetical protein QM483_10450 [Desulfuromusa sp.]
METLALLLIVFSALMHALWNLLVKQSRDKTGPVMLASFLSFRFGLQLSPVSYDGVAKSPTSGVAAVFQDLDLLYVGLRP